MKFSEIPILMYHEISDLNNPWCISQKEFCRQMNLLKKEDYKTISLTRLKNGIENNEDTNEKFIVITFDDGREGVYSKAYPILRDNGFVATLYVVPSWIDGKEIPLEEQHSTFMSWNNLKELSNHGYDIGSHTFSHQWLVKLENEELRKEIDLADVAIKKKIGLDVKHFCYPYGSFNEQIRELVIGRYDTAVSTIQNFSKIMGAYSRQWVMYDTSLEQFKRLLIEPVDQENPKWYNDIIRKLQKSIIISNSDKEILIQHAKSKEPYESCAILIGEENEQGWKVIEVFLTENIEKSKINFTISPQEEFKIDEIAKQKNLEIVSIFHSHPTSEPTPSITDKKFMRVNPFPWIIYSGITNTMKAYSIDLELNDISIDVV
tara:strand:+ start:133 stop:1260 length:1128 start_codon:yes stop_codon:yes gene_type:complete